jgi:hypothetical protein
MVKGIWVAAFMMLTAGTEAQAFAGKTSGLNGRLIVVLRHIESHFGRELTVTSGCRSHAHNRHIGGAKESYHLRCLAADIRIEGISKAQVARYADGLAGRGGVGSYCHDASIHVDVGPRRNWYWGCHGQRSFSQGSFHRSSARVLRLRRYRHY